MMGTKQLFGTIDFHSRKKNTIDLNGDVNSSKYLPLCSAERKKLIQVCNNLRVMKTEFSFLGAGL